MASATAQQKSRPRLSREQATQVALAYWRANPWTYAHFASRGTWQPYAWLKHLSAIVRRAVARGNARIIVNVPPRHGKSELISFWAPIWFLDKDPSKRVQLGSYSADIATDFGRRVRNEIHTNELIELSLREDSKAAGRWNTPEGGGMIAVGVGGSLSGRGGDLIVIDDPHKDWADAYSHRKRQRVIDWYKSTVYTRQEPNASIILVQTRWHEDDLAGYLLAQDDQEWQLVRLPALAEQNDPIGRNPGEALCPERYDVDRLQIIRRDVGTAVWGAEYQQDPEQLGSGRVYYGFGAETIDNAVVLRDDLPLQVSVDFNSHPHMHLVVGQYDKRLDEFVAYDEIADPKYRHAQAAGKALCEWVDRQGSFKWPELQLFGDATGKASGRNVATGISEWTALRTAINAGMPHIHVRLRIPRVNPHIPDRTTTFNDALHDAEGAIHYRVHSRCRRLLVDLREMREGEDGLPDDTDRMMGHASAAEGYRVWYQRPIKTKQTGTVSGRATI